MSVFESLLNTICVVQNKTTTVDSTGNPVETWADAYTGVACRLQEVSGEEAVMLSRLAVVASHKLWLKADQAVTENNRVTFGGKNYQVTFVRGRPGGETHHLEVMLKIVT